MTKQDDINSTIKSTIIAMVKISRNKLGFCLIFVFSVLAIGIFETKPSLALPLSPGDRIRLLIPEGELFSGVYEVNIDGSIQIPYLEPLPVKGLEISEVKQKIYRTLIDR